MNTISNSYRQSVPHTQDKAYGHVQMGFGAALMILMFAFGALSLALVANQAALTYADSTQKTFERVQADLDRRACTDSVDLVKTKDAFASGDVDIADLNCHVHL
jgi:hypothetical protein